MTKIRPHIAEETSPQTHIVDDDDALRDALSYLLRSRGVSVATYASAEDFLARFNLNMRGCILTDVRMGGMSGLEMFDHLETMQCRLPAIVLTGHGNVAMAVNALKSGMRDFIEKPFNTNNLVDKIVAAMTEDSRADDQRQQRSAFITALATLSPRERDVMDLLLAGKMNKVIADQLDISMRTVEVHRSRIFNRMGVRSAVELANLFSRMK